MIEAIGYVVGAGAVQLITSKRGRFWVAIAGAVLPCVLLWFLDAMGPQPIVGVWALLLSASIMASFGCVAGSMARAAATRGGPATLVDFLAALGIVVLAWIPAAGLTTFALDVIRY